MGINTLTYRFIIILSFLHIGISLRSQSEIKSEFIFHTVSRGETSYGISKKYQVDLNDFFSSNPEASKGLVKGQILKIPIKPYINNESGSNQDSLFKKHVVLEGETLWAIAKTYGVQVLIIKSYNQLLSNVLKKDQLLLIPNILADTSDIIRPLIKHVDHPLLNKCDTIIIHNVKKKETLYSISKKYNLSIDKIISNNLFIDNEGLLKNQNLRIKLRIKDCLDDTLSQINDSISIIDSIDFNHKILRVSIVLPFFIDESDLIIQNCPENTDCSIDKMTKNSLEIYNGVKIAMIELKNLGYNLELNLFDTKYDTNFLNKILNDSIFKLSNLIIGPLYSKNIKITRKFSKINNIPMISPYNIPSQGLFNYPNLFKISPSRSTQSKEMAKYIKNNNSNDNILVITDSKDIKSTVYSNIFSDVFNSNLLNIDSIILEDSITKRDSILFNDSLIPIPLIRGEDWSFILNKLSTNKKNIIVLCSNQIPFLTYSFNQIIEFSNSKDHYKSKFIIFGFEDLYRMKTIDIKYKNKFNLHFASKGILDYKSENVKIFIEKYQKNFSSQPNSFSYLGYDILKSIFHKFYPFNNEINDVYSGVQYEINFGQIESNSGSENKFVNFYNITDYKLVKLLKN
jgi:LysM repeat protein